MEVPKAGNIWAKVDGSLVLVRDINPETDTVTYSLHHDADGFYDREFTIPMELFLARLSYQQAESGPSPTPAEAPASDPQAP